MANGTWETLAASRLGDGFTTDVQRRLEEELSRLRAAWPTLVMAPERFVERLLADVETERPLPAKRAFRLVQPERPGHLGAARL